MDIRKLDGYNKSERYFPRIPRKSSSRVITLLSSEGLKHMYRPSHELSDSTGMRSRFSDGISRNDGSQRCFVFWDLCILSAISLLLGVFEKKFESSSPMLSGSTA
jgi:hypothetical protein